jgi:hypothetical protein
MKSIGQVLLELSSANGQGGAPQEEKIKKKKVKKVGPPVLKIRGTRMEGPEVGASNKGLRAKGR